MEVSSPLCGPGREVTCQSFRLQRACTHRRHTLPISQHSSPIAPAAPDLPGQSRGSVNHQPPARSAWAGNGSVVKSRTPPAFCCCPGLELPHIKLAATHLTKATVTVVQRQEPGQKAHTCQALASVTRFSTKLFEIAPLLLAVQTPTPCGARWLRGQTLLLPLRSPIQ